MNATTLLSNRKENRPCVSSPWRSISPSLRFAKRIDPGAIARRGFRPRTARPAGPSLAELLPDIGEQRLDSMDEAGITVEVLSNTGPGPDPSPAPTASPWRAR